MNNDYLFDEQYLKLYRFWIKNIIHNIGILKLKYHFTYYKIYFQIKTFTFNIWTKADNVKNKLK